MRMNIFIGKMEAKVSLNEVVVTTLLMGRIKVMDGAEITWVGKGDKDKGIRNS